MDTKKKYDALFESLMAHLKMLEENPTLMDEKEMKFLARLKSQICKATGISEALNWAVTWTVDKWHSMEDKISGVLPYETVSVTENMVLDVGANEMLNLICGAGTAFNNANAKVYVGTDSTAENASQNGVQATGTNRAFASMDTGYPVVQGRTATFRGTFGEDAANFDWREASITNGTGANSIAMNRKVSPMGTKNGGTWTMQIVITLVNAS